MTFLFCDNFLWGVATAGYQVEGRNINSQWFVWEKINATKLASKAKRRYGKLPNWKELRRVVCRQNNYRSGEAANSYNEYWRDADLVRKLNMNAYRMSVEWSRIEPKEGEFDQAAIDHYISMIDLFRKNHIEVMVTLFHFSLPIWFANKGGFLETDNIKYFLRYVRKFMNAVGKRVKYVITINEPTIYSIYGYLLKEWPPMVCNPVKFLKVYNNLAKAHNQATEIIHQLGDYQVSIAKHTVDFYASKKQPIGYLLSKIFQWAFDYYFLNKVVSSCDYLGVNYYTNVCLDIFKRPKIINNDLGWGMQPSRIQFVLERFNKKYQKPIFITENGVADKDDKYREWWIEETVQGMKKAMANGVDLRGYFHWSLSDNFEWANGWCACFGLAELDRTDFSRKLRPSGKWFAQVIANCRFGLGNK